MNIMPRRFKVKRKVMRHLIALACATLLIPGKAVLLASAHAGPLPQAVVKIPADQLDSLVAPIALYPDNLLGQTLVASTYPLEIIQLKQWLDRNQNLAGDQKKLTEAVQKQSWDASIQAMAVLPDVVKRLADDIQWTTDLGNAFLAQQSDVMDAVQRMRTKAQDKGSLKSNEQQKVATQTVESKQVIVIEQSNPEVVYVPSYDPVYIYGPPVYPYPPIYYPPYYGGYYAAAAISFGVGIAIGIAWGGGWGWGCGWGGGDININRNNNFNRNTNIGGGNRGNIGGGNRVNPLGGGGNKWQHNPSHRGGAPYADQRTADRFGGTTRGDSLANRQGSARNQIGRQGGSLGSTTRPGGVGDRGGLGSGGGFGDRGSVANRGGGGGGDRVGNRSLGSGSSSRGGFGGFSGSDSRRSSSRGSSSMGSRGGFGGGGGSRGGFGGGGGRGGGGRR